MDVPNYEDLHFVLVPLMAQGHMIPMLDIARLLAFRGVTVSYITTPLNAARIRPSFDRTTLSGLPISLVELPFPSADVGLPEGCENVDELPSRDLSLNFYEATKLLLNPLIEYLRDHHTPPSCLITDSVLPWTREVARAFRMRRLIFHGFNCFSILCFYNLYKHNVLESIASESDHLVVPGLPHKVELTKEQLRSSTLKELREEMREADETADGVVINSFEELEFEYLKTYRESTGKKAWTIGPVSLSNKDDGDKIERGKKASIDEKQCFEWLETKEPNSVVYVSFGSIGRLRPPQMEELGSALEGSGHHFIWVVKAGDALPKKFEEEPITERWMVIRGWAPQVAILSRLEIGGFVTHCGWNSTIEGLCAGVPMVTWPLFAEQFLNERLVVDVLHVGVSVGVQRPNGWLGEVEGEVVEREVIGLALKRLMDGGEKCRARRERARELGDMAREAMEVGGSSYVNLTRVIEDVLKYKSMVNVEEDGRDNEL
ncbi:UDP-glycosyltransferase 73C3 [Acorus gramineus]|uniref:Glycosyltransferase n=1 Tax=Acorus gramineus TaxID=55184 RepID=A0AAV9AXR9_ACOGR|nr:UDP-glycosyltransferase 73C3 [Acorus gramineus]